MEKEVHEKARWGQYELSLELNINTQHRMPPVWPLLGSHRTRTESRLSTKGKRNLELVSTVGTIEDRHSELMLAKPKSQIGISGQCGVVHHGRQSDIAICLHAKIKMATQEKRARNNEGDLQKPPNEL